jgi:hypothetical protein
VTRAQIITEIIIGLFLLIVGAVSRPLLKRLWQRMNRPSPLSPEYKGQLTKSLAMYEMELDRLNYFAAHSKDLFLYLLGGLFTVLFLSITATIIYIFPPFHSTDTHPYLTPRFAIVLLLLLFADGLCLVGAVESSKLSDKKLQGNKTNLQKRIDQIRDSLNT